MKTRTSGHFDNELLVFDAYFLNLGGSGASCFFLPTQSKPAIQWKNNQPDQLCVHQHDVEGDFQTPLMTRVCR